MAATAWDNACITVPRLSRVDAESAPSAGSATPWAGLRVPECRFSFLRGGRRRPGTLSGKSRLARRGGGNLQ